MQNLSTGTWASVGESCPVQCSVDGSDLVHLVIGEDDHCLKLIFNAAGLRKLAATSSEAVAEMDTLVEQEDRQRAKLDQAAERSA